MSNSGSSLFYKHNLTLKVEEFYELNSYILWYDNFNQHTFTRNLDNIRITKEAGLLEDEYEPIEGRLLLDDLLI